MKNQNDNNTTTHRRRATTKAHTSVTVAGAGDSPTTVPSSSSSPSLSTKRDKYSSSTNVKGKILRLRNKFLTLKKVSQMLVLLLIGLFLFLILPPTIRLMNTSSSSEIWTWETLSDGKTSTGKKVRRNNNRKRHFRLNTGSNAMLSEDEVESSSSSSSSVHTIVDKAVYYKQFYSTNRKHFTTKLRNNNQGTIPPRVLHLMTVIKNRTIEFDYSVTVPPPTSPPLLASFQRLGTKQQIALASVEIGDDSNDDSDNYSNKNKNNRASPRTLKKRYIELRMTNPRIQHLAESPYQGKNKECGPVAPQWQLGYNPTCVKIHEESSGFQNLFTAPIRKQKQYSPTVVVVKDPNSSSNSLSDSGGGNTTSATIMEQPHYWKEYDTVLHDMRSRRNDDDVEQYEQLRLVNRGAFRHVWMIRDPHDEQSGNFNVNKRAMKTLRSLKEKEKQFDLRNGDRHRRDAIAFEQLQQSPLVVDIYGYCSNTAIFDFADGGDLTTLFSNDHDDEKDGGANTLSKLQIMKIAYNVSKSVHDAHHLDGYGRPTMAHTDIKIDQFILSKDGYYKLSDFNRVRFLMWNSTAKPTIQEQTTTTTSTSTGTSISISSTGISTNTKLQLWNHTSGTGQCGFDVGKNGGEYRSPEEYAYKKETEKVDVYSLGNVLYFLLTQGKEVWDGVNNNDVYKFVMNGQRPPIPKDILLKARNAPKTISNLNNSNSIDINHKDNIDNGIFEKYMVLALTKSWIHNPRERASALEVATIIQRGIDILERNNQNQQKHTHTK